MNTQDRVAAPRIHSCSDVSLRTCVCRQRRHSCGTAASSSCNRRGDPVRGNRRRASTYGVAGLGGKFEESNERRQDLSVWLCPELITALEKGKDGGCKFLTLGTLHQAGYWSIVVPHAAPEGVGGDSSYPLTCASSACAIISNTGVTALFVCLLLCLFYVLARNLSHSITAAVMQCCASSLRRKQSPAHTLSAMSREHGSNSFDCRGFHPPA